MHTRLQVGLIVLVALATLTPGQFQPLAPPDFSDLEARTDIAEAGSIEGALRVARFVQVSDAHIIDDDAPYPLRQEPLDEMGPPFEGAQRPQDEYTDELLDRIIAAVNAVHGLDALDFVINTGDNIDNELENELMRFIDNWEGTFTTTGPFSQFECKPDGQSADVSDDSQDVVDACTHLPDSMAQQTSLAAGLPWFSAFGNHDGLIQGNMGTKPSFQELAAEFGRYFLSQPEYVSMHFRAGSSCPGGTAPAGDVLDDFGHGYGFAGTRLCDEDPDNDGYYAFNLRGVRFVVLDTINDDFVQGNDNLAELFSPEATLGHDILGGYAEGAIDPVQYAWMLDQIDTNQDKLVIIFSHHTLNSMLSNNANDACCGPNGEGLADILTAAGYPTSDDIQAALSERSNVIAWIGGHTHRHHIEPKLVDGAGFWNVESSSVIDMPQEVRAIELWVTADGNKGFLAMRSFTHDHELARELAAGDRHRAADAEGTPQDQDVLLWFDIPSTVTVTPQPSLPRALVVQVVEPVLVNGTHGQEGDTIPLALSVTDNLLGRPVSGLNVSARVVHTSPEDFTTSVVDFDGRLQETVSGRYSGAFLVEDAVTHFASFRLVDPNGTFPDADRAVSIRIEPDASEKPDGKKSPGIAFGLLVAAVVFAARQKR